jgi:flagellar biosynthetic protein FliR
MEGATLEGAAMESAAMESAAGALARVLAGLAAALAGGPAGEAGVGEAGLGEAGALAAGFVAVFLRVGAVVALLPGFGEQTLALRLRLAAALALALAVWPMVHAALPDLESAPRTAPWAMALVFLAEAVAGLALGIALRLMIMVLQFAGSIAAQATAISQIFGPGVTPDPLPAAGNLLVMAGIALALAAGLHVKAAAMIALSYELLPFGRFPGGADLARWGVAQTARAFALSVTLAGPFVLFSFLYNLALGAINRAMPSLMVAFVGAPFVTLGAIFLMALAAPALLAVWLGALGSVLADPLGLPR